jgi:hypothetical protein
MRFIRADARSACPSCGHYGLRYRRSANRAWFEFVMVIPAACDVIAQTRNVNVVQLIPRLLTSGRKASVHTYKSSISFLSPIEYSATIHTKPIAHRRCSSKAKASPKLQKTRDPANFSTPHTTPTTTPTHTKPTCRPSAPLRPVALPSSSPSALLSISQ